MNILKEFHKHYKLDEIQILAPIAGLNAINKLIPNNIIPISV